jgi:hypothetical protein
LPLPEGPATQQAPHVGTCQRSIRSTSSPPYALRKFVTSIKALTLVFVAFHLARARVGSLHAWADA